ncbi:primosomal protein DnaI, partial [Enterococcus faecalis]
MNQRYEELVSELLKDQDVQAFIQANRQRLSDEDIRKSYAKLYEFGQEKKKFQVNDPAMLAPGYVPRLMLNFHYIDLTNVPTADL